ncbi:MAG: hypothetical protein MUD14_14445 [Hydrococcus sp. Prado102]|nr:hypothetical protein [Hydrococcus sp. Prado102]
MTEKRENCESSDRNLQRCSENESSSELFLNFLLKFPIFTQEPKLSITVKNINAIASQFSTNLSKV